MAGTTKYWYLWRCSELEGLATPEGKAHKNEAVVEYCFANDGQFESPFRGYDQTGHQRY